MYNISYKYKGFLLLLIKLVIVLGAFYFIYIKLVNNQLLSITELKQQLSILFSKSLWLLILLLIFTDLNWLLEIYKWKILASVEKRISFFEAFQQSLASLTASIITPNRIGEYGTKALYFEKKSRKKIVLLNFIGNISQLAITIALGVIGIVFLLVNFTFKIPHFNFIKLLLLCCLIVLVIVFKNKLGITKTIKHYFNKTTIYLKQIPKSIYFKVLGLSALRYFIFSHQFYFLFKILGVETDYITLINLIFCIYFMASIIPSLAIFDWVIKGSIAIIIFSFIELNQLTIVTITSIMWLLNFAIPAVFGSIFVMNFKLINNE